MHTTKFHTALFNQIREDGGYIAFGDTDLSTYIFKHPTHLRLTFKGLGVLKSLYTAYEFPIDEHLNARCLIHLARHVDYPYYIGKKRLVLFSREDAMMIKLFGGDVKEFLNRDLDS